MSEPCTVQGKGLWPSGVLERPLYGSLDICYDNPRLMFWLAMFVDAGSDKDRVPVCSRGTNVIICALDVRSRIILLTLAFHPDHLMIRIHASNHVDLLQTAL